MCLTGLILKTILLNRINKTSIPLSKYLTSSVRTVKRKPTLISLNKPKSMKLNTEPAWRVALQSLAPPAGHRQMQPRRAGI